MHAAFANCYFLLMQGLFPTLIVSILNRKKKPCFVQACDFRQLRHAIKLKSEKFLLPVTFVDEVEYIDVYFNGESEDCYRLREVIVEALSACSDILNFDMKKLSVLVHCKQKHKSPHNDRKPHPITISYEKESPRIGCSVETELEQLKLTDLDEKRSCWLRGK